MFMLKYTLMRGNKPVTNVFQVMYPKKSQSGQLSQHLLSTCNVRVHSICPQGPNNIEKVGGSRRPNEIQAVLEIQKLCRGTSERRTYQAVPL